MLRHSYMNCVAHHLVARETQSGKNNSRRPELCSVVNYLVFHVILLFCHILIDNHAQRSFFLSASRFSVAFYYWSSGSSWKTCQCEGCM